jgi:glycosyltransferase involved in cell wall biosynthesis
MISVAIITFNEEKNIERCLKSLCFGPSGWETLIDDIVILDSGSTDRTESLAKSFPKVRWEIQVPFLGHIQQKQKAAEMAKNDWILSLDADEALTETLQQSILQASLNTRNAFLWNRLNHFGAKPIRHGRWYPDAKVRLWNRNEGKWGGINPHDKVVLTDGVQVHHLLGDLLHFTCRDEAHFKTTMRHYAALGNRARTDLGKKNHPFQGWLGGLFHFVADYFFRLGFLDGKPGWIIAREQFWYTVRKYRNSINQK